MANLFKIAGFLIILAMAIGCNQKPPANLSSESEGLSPRALAEKELLDEVTVIHDEVMPKIGSIVLLQEELQSQLDSLKSKGVDPEVLYGFREKIINLKKADSAMMAWMHQFEMVQDSVTHEQRMKYLEHEKKRISKVRDMINSSLEEAREVVE